MQATQRATSERLLDLRHTTSLQFREEHWKRAGELTGCSDLVGCYHRLGQLHWGDHGYDACVLHVLTSIVERNPEALAILEELASTVCADAGEDAFAHATLTRL